MPNACLNAATHQVNKVSECGLFQDFVTVGPKPKISVRTTSITDKTGCFTTSQRKRENRARIKNTISEIVYEEQGAGVTITLKRIV